ncbi:L,D-transpeptidase [Kutzneria buriramensis]|uniref:L,D-transpeptidase-like protein n=1 Tax=Kutzneria buriramensis TaxID=1045776 RepID=A0A3E0HYY8_9PSEU|nr:L,D-transpeptidase [Kutzneria buriramensis]REH51669.1 L,D-transpeptidase-like protein [Kutzneria buriramensis]
MTSTVKLAAGAAIAAGCAVCALATPALAAPSAPCSAAARACVDLSTHQAWLMRGGAVTYGPVPAMPGMASAPTDPGTFRVTFKDLHHRSTIFNNAPMPYSVFFNGGDAFHEGSLSVPSHGCVHLAHTAAAEFYADLQPGDVVQVVP